MNMHDKSIFPDPPTMPIQDSTRQLIAPNEPPHVLLKDTCIKCGAKLGHYSKDGKWKYPGAKCEDVLGDKKCRS